MSDFSKINLQVKKIVDKERIGEETELMKNIDVFSNLTDIVGMEKEQMELIVDRMPELHRASRQIGHKNSQTACSLMQMTMLSDSPLSRMKQCLAQLNKKYNAVKDNYFRVEKTKIEIKQLENNRDESSQLRIQEYNASIIVNQNLMTNALRQIGMYQDMYEAIRKNNNIPIKWSESDYEKQEIEHMIKSLFRLAIQDLHQTNKCSKASAEYSEQLGIHPQVMEVRTRNYMADIYGLLESGKYVDITNMHKFLDDMVIEFGDAYKIALKRVGLNEIGSERFMASNDHITRG